MRPDENDRTCAEQWIHTLLLEHASDVRESGVLEFLTSASKADWMNGALEAKRIGLYLLLKETRATFAPVMYKIRRVLKAMGVCTPVMRKREDFLAFIDAAIEALEQQVHECL
jgi:hypothetical protein